MHLRDYRRLQSSKKWAKSCVSAVYAYNAKQLSGECLRLL